MGETHSYWTGNKRVTCPFEQMLSNSWMGYQVLWTACVNFQTGYPNDWTACENYQMGHTNDWTACENFLMG